MISPISSSVGQGGKNEPNDVEAVQRLLNDHGGAGRELLKVDGKSGQKTVARIIEFQKTSFGSADGRVDPGGRTIERLLNQHLARLAAGLNKETLVELMGAKPGFVMSPQLLMQAYLRLLRGETGGSDDSGDECDTAAG